MPHKV
jgi:hypothetical protein